MSDQEAWSVEGSNEKVPRPVGKPGNQAPSDKIGVGRIAHLKASTKSGSPYLRENRPSTGGGGGVIGHLPGSDDLLPRWSPTDSVRGSPESRRPAHL